VSIASSQDEERVLIVAPTGADGGNVRDVLVSAGMHAHVCPNLSAIALEIAQGCGAVIVTEEAFDYERSGDLVAAIKRQPPWSDLPLVVIVSGANYAEASSAAVKLIRPRSNFTLVERPLRKETLVSTMQSALRARRRQYEVRELLRERDDLLASLEQRVADRTAKLQELNAELEAFSYSVSHDLRAPLRSVETYARILCDEYSDHLPFDAKTYVQRIVKNAEQMDRLMQDVLTLSRIARSDVRLEPVDLDHLFAEVIDLYPNLAAAHHCITLRSPLGFVVGHAPSLTQCFSNLLQNALKFAAVSRDAAIEIYAETNGPWRRISVRDNGIGIDPAHQGRIFGLFERASPSSVPGTGIGLAIVKKAAERMGGHVGVESVLGQGSCFWIELPRADPESVASDAGTKQSTFGAPLASGAVPET
jgi:signal transduction histidine kinase